MTWKIIALFVVAAAFLGAGEDGFSVKELSSQQIDAISVVQNKVDAAQERLTKAEEEFREAALDLETLKKQIADSFHQIPMNCMATPTNLDGSVKKISYREVEVRGNYALISEGTLECSTMFTLTPASGSSKIKWGFGH